MGRTVRTDRYRYVEWRHQETGERAGEELYDYGSGPLESENVAGRPENKARLEEMRGRLRAGWRAALPPGRDD